MKKFGVLMFVTAALFFVSQSNVSAQVRLSLNINAQPQWGPVDNDYVEYYYMPEYDMYYYAPEAQFVYRSGSRWLFSTTLPYQYRNADLYRTYKVVVNENKPYLRNDYYRNHYRGYRNYHSRQGSIRDSRDSRYNESRNRPDNSRYNRVGNSRYSKGHTTIINRGDRTNVRVQQQRPDNRRVERVQRKSERGGDKDRGGKGGSKERGKRDH